MTAVDVFGAEAHIHCAFIHLSHLLANHFKVFRSVNLSTEHILHVARINLALVAHLVECVFGIHFAIVVLAELLNVLQPHQPILFQDFVKRLGSHGIVKELNSNFLNPTILDHSLEVLLGKGYGAADCHAAFRTVDDGFQHQVFEDQISVHQQDVVVHEAVFGAVNAVDVVGLVVQRVVDERNLQGEAQEIAIVNEDLVEIASGHHNFFDPVFDQLPQLPAKDGVVVRYFGHAFWMFACQHAHAVT